MGHGIIGHKAKADGRQQRQHADGKGPIRDDAG